MRTERIAILGATSHIAKGLIYNFIKSGRDNKLFLFSRSPERAKEFLTANGLKGDIHIKRFHDFPRYKYDTIINCVGLGTPNKIKSGPALIFKLTEEFDNMVMAYLDKYPQGLYINFSSGAVYGNNIKTQDYYSIAKINSEAKHRCRQDLNIMDIRVFAYFSRFIDLNSGYFLSELVRSIKKGEELVTNSCDFIRDYLGPQDLFSLIKLIIKNKPFNGALDAYSNKPVSKFKLLDFFNKKYALRYVVDNNIKFCSPTGAKDVYCSKFHGAAKLGYKPEFSSLETIKTESEFILG